MTAAGLAYGTEGVHVERPEVAMTIVRSHHDLGPVRPETFN